MGMAQKCYRCITKYYDTGNDSDVHRLFCVFGDSITNSIFFRRVNITELMNDWNLVTNCLPKDSELKLVSTRTMKIENGTTRVVDEVAVAYLDFVGGEPYRWVNKFDETCITYKVVAWRHFPRVYNGDIFAKEMYIDQI